tara:strand:- start:47 stop:373 length:327 start_codon:yes stop_codon:yes gene_type:complete
MNLDNNIPELVEPNVKYFLNSTLKKCNKFKAKYMNFIYNIGLTLLFFTILSIILMYNYKGKKTAKELLLKKQKDKEYILKQLIKIKQQNVDDRRMQNNLITNLPLYKN